MTRTALVGTMAPRRIVRRFPSVAALADAAESSRQMDHFGLSSCGGETAADALRYTREGDDRLVSAASALIEEFALEIDTDRSAWLPDICGAYPIVPEFLAGQPECMRRRQRVPSAAAPLAVYVNVAASYACDAALMARRGTAILAFVLAMARVRPIALHVYSATQNQDGSGPEYVLTAPIDTAPLDIATAAYALTSAGFFRRIAYAICSAALGGERINWAKAWLDDKAAYNRGLVAELGGDDDTLLIDGAFSNDPLISDPKAWLRDQLARFGGGES